jgi:aminoglycoside N3'-acetyltransferase
MQFMMRSIKITHMQRQIKKTTSLTAATIGRVLAWGQFLMSQPDFRWTQTDTTTMGLLADEIRRIKHQQYLLSTKHIIKRK